MTLYQVFLRGTVAGVVVSDDVVVETAPVLRRFVGQRLDRLTGWVKKNGGEIKFVSSL